MEEKFVLTPKEQNKVLWGLYFRLMQCVLTALLIAVLFSKWEVLNQIIFAADSRPEKIRLEPAFMNISMFSFVTAYFLLGLRKRIRPEWILAPFLISTALTMIHFFYTCSWTTIGIIIGAFLVLTIFLYWFGMIFPKNLYGIKKRLLIVLYLNIIVTILAFFISAISFLWLITPIIASIIFGLLLMIETGELKRKLADTMSQEQFNDLLREAFYRNLISCCGIFSVSEPLFSTFFRIGLIRKL